MKTKYTIIAIAAVLAAFAGCKKNSAPSAMEKSLTISVGTESKTLLRKGSEVRWSSTDKISVFDTENSRFTFTTTSSDVPAADFTCANWTGTTPVMAVHCNGSAASQNVYDGSKITSFLNNKQVIYNRESYGKEAALSVGRVADNGGSYHIEEMKNCFSLIKFTLLDTTITAVSVKSNNDEYLAGWVDVDFNALEQGQAFWTANTEKSCFNTIDLSVTGSGCRVKGNGIFADTTAYYISVLPQTLSEGVTITMTRSDGKVGVREVKTSINLERSHVKAFSDPIDKGVAFKAVDIVLDCTNADNFRYDKAGTAAQLPARGTPRSYCQGEFWLVGKEDYKFEGNVYRWNKTLATDDKEAGLKVKLPLIDGYVLGEVEVTYSNAGTDRVYSIVDADGTSYGSCTRNSSTTGSTVISLSTSALSGKVLYLKSNSEMCAKFILTYKGI